MIRFLFEGKKMIRFLKHFKRLSKVFEGIKNESINGRLKFLFLEPSQYIPSCTRNLVCKRLLHLKLHIEID